MLEKINLFPKIEAVWEKRVRIRRLLQVVSVVVLILYFVFLSSLLSYFLILTGEEKSLKRKIETYEERVKGLEAVESKQVFLSSKLKAIAKVFKFEERPEEALEDLEVLVLPGINLLGINYKDKEIKINGEARDAVVLGEFVKNLEDKGRSFFSQAEFGSINKKTEGDYTFSLLLLR